MHDIWNPWHGCTKCSEGCLNCYMYYLDNIRGGGPDSSECFRTDNFDYPVKQDRRHSYVVKSGEKIRVCMTSDFFLEDADPWRADAWRLIQERSDVIFFILTKRPQRVEKCLPKTWGEGWENVFFNVTCENQRRADERLPILLDLPFKHKGFMNAPCIGPVSALKFLESGKIEQVLCGGENYEGSRPCHYEWVKGLREECVKNNVTFNFIETGNVFVKDGKSYFIKSKREQARQAFRSGLNFRGKPMDFKLSDALGFPIPDEELYVPHYRRQCQTCASRLTCNGCGDCGKCTSDIISKQETAKWGEGIGLSK